MSINQSLGVVALYIRSGAHKVTLFERANNKITGMRSSVSKRIGPRYCPTWTVSFIKAGDINSLFARERVL
ncbi:hypothetical protein, partial [Acidiphilium sp. PM]|uniref:hypothetical protein n=1 Tax=Acidiphilium sp. PM TaxID=1043206 RepID=UPI0019D7064C